MRSRDVEEKRKAARHALGRLAAMFIGDDALPHYCVVSDFSEGGVRINANGHKIPDQFVLVFSSSLPHRNGTYKVAWRNGNIVGAEFVSATAPRS
jgi:PilZ domain